MEHGLGKWVGVQEGADGNAPRTPAPPSMLMLGGEEGSYPASPQALSCSPLYGGHFLGGAALTAQS